MQIGNVIRKYRKEKDMTQEEVASYLGVSAPAVNKWENGNACPDITLLAPLARLFGISTDTLLSYKEELSDKERVMVVNEIAESLMKEQYETVFEQAMEKIKEYPNDDYLALTLAQILEAYFSIEEVKEQEKYKETLHELSKRGLNSGDPKVRESAVCGLFNQCIIREEYEEAQKYLDMIPESFTNRNSMQALLYKRSGDTEKAYELYERIMFLAYSEFLNGAQGVYSLAIKDGNLEKAESLIEKVQKMIDIVEFGDYAKYQMQLIFALDRQDKEECLALLEKLIEQIQTADAYKRSKLWEHMKFSGETEYKKVAQMTKRIYERDEQTAFLKEDERFVKLMERLERMS